jgi:hypothetical protein
MYQCCKVCKLLATEEIESGTISMYVPSCPHFNFIDKFNFYPDSDGGVNGLHEYANSQNAVEIGNAFFRARLTTEEYATKETPRSVDKLLSSAGFDIVEVPRLSDEEIADIRLEASDDKMPEHLLSEEEHDELMELADDDLEPEDQPWHEFSSGNRNGVYYEYLGSFWEAFIEPFLWGHACENGVHRYTGTVFADEIELGGAITNGRRVSPLLLEKISKVFYAEMVLQTKEEVHKCFACILPVAGEDETCPYCRGEVDVSMYFQKAIGLMSSLDFETAVGLNKSLVDIAYLLDAENFVKFINKVSPVIYEPKEEKIS